MVGKRKMAAAGGAAAAGDAGAGRRWAAVWSSVFTFINSQAWSV
jgi:hypothetical protein